MVASSLDLAQAGGRREDVGKEKHDRERGRVFVPRAPPIAVANGSAGHGRESPHSRRYVAEKVRKTQGGKNGF
jgi:hypothetical protein